MSTLCPAPRGSELDIAPSVAGMKGSIGLKWNSGIHRLVGAPEDRDVLGRRPNRARALEVLKVPEAAKPAAPARENVVPLRKSPPAMRPIAANDIVEVPLHGKIARSEEHTSELQSLMRISYAVFCLKKKKKQTRITTRVSSMGIKHSKTSNMHT